MDVPLLYRFLLNANTRLLSRVTRYVGSLHDFDKHGLIFNSDFIIMRNRIVELSLRVTTIPTAGSFSEAFGARRK